MKELSLYEQLGIVLPGAGLLLGIVVLEPSVQPLFLGNGLTIGGLGLFVIIAYALGHLVAAAGNVVEGAVWLCLGGLPSQWVRKPKNWLLMENRRSDLFKKIKSRLEIDLDESAVVDRRHWEEAFHVIYRDVLSSGSAGRVDSFNGSYGLNRGLSAACLLLIPLLAHKAPLDWAWWSVGLALMALVYAYRMYRFGVHFAREVLVRFMLLPDSR